MLTLINRFYQRASSTGMFAKLRKRPRNEKGEPAKVVVHTSWPRALRRCMLHIVPICTTIFIIVINVKGLFIGSDFVGPIKSETINLMLLQIAAKAHELMIVASLGLIVLQMVRHELLFGDGLPLGLIGSGLTFADISFFFQKEFYGALRYVAKGNILRKLCFIAILLIAGFIAALAGPSSAVLLVPKAQTWPSGGTHFYLNGSSEQFWPSDLSRDLAELKTYCSADNSTSLSICPGAGYPSLLNHWGRMNYTDFAQQDVRSYAQSLSGSQFYWPIHSPDSGIPPLYALGDFRKNDQPSSNTFLVQPHAAVSAVLQHIADDWWNMLIKDQKMDPRIIDDRQISALLVRTPLASVRCSDPQNVSLNDYSIRFPTIGGRFFYSNTANFNVTTFDNNTSDHLRFRWVHLPDSFGAVSIGGIFESPWTVDSGSRVVVGCTAQLGWVPATLYTDKYTFWTGWYTWDLIFGDRTPEFVDGSVSPTNGRIALGDDWLRLLTPSTQQNESNDLSWQPTTIESILVSAGLGDIPPILNGSDLTSDWVNADNNGSKKTSFLESIIASVLVDGLSRTGSYRAFDIQPNTTSQASGWPLSLYEPSPDFDNLLFHNRTAFLPPSIPSTDFTTLRVDMCISGFSFRGSLAGYLSMSVLVVHLLMATCHMAWILFNRHSSWSWNSVSELIALAHNSPPTVTALKNTGAGLEKAATFANIAKIRVRKNAVEDVENESDRVELVFEDNEEVMVEVKANANAQGANQTRMATDIELGSTSQLALHPSLRAGSSVVSITESVSSGTQNNPKIKVPAAATWPIDPMKMKLSTTSEATEIQVRGRSNSTESLIPRAHLARGAHRLRSLVKVDQAYG